MIINSRSLDDLHPEVKKLAETFITACRDADIDVLITSTFRNHESQAALFAIGRTKPGRIVTNAGPGQSFHNWRVAFDFVPIVHGKAMWESFDLFQQCGWIAENAGLEWAGRWKTIRELAHCQFTGGLTIEDFQNGKTF